MSEITGIPTTTLARMEEGIQSYPIDELEKLCAFYAYKKDDLYIESKPIPDWRRLRSKVISAHKLDRKVHNALHSKPRPVLALEFRVLQTDFLNTYKKVGEIRNFIIKEYKWDFISSSITNALDRLVERKLIASRPISGSLFEYKKAIPGNPIRLNSFNVNTMELSQEIAKKHSSLVTRYIYQMSCIIGFLASGPAKRSDIMDNIDYANLTKNVKNILGKKEYLR